MRFFFAHKQAIFYKGNIMAVQLPNGVLFSLATSYGSNLVVTAATNAAPPVITSNAHGLVNGDIIECNLGWQKLAGRVFRVSGVTANTFNLEGEDSTVLLDYPAGTGTGTVRKITGFTQITQVTDLSTSGGEPNYATYEFLENDFESQIPTGSTAQSIELTIGDDPSLPGYLALKAASNSRAIRALRAAYPGGSTAYYNGYAFLNETPTLSKGNINVVNASFSLLGRPVRYAV
jgi:hypothetical protein